MRTENIRGKNIQTVFSNFSELMFAMKQKTQDTEKIEIEEQLHVFESKVIDY